jgi:hypothetical protein
VTHADPVVIVSAVRTPLGRFQGDLSSLTSSEFVNSGYGTTAIAVERSR